MCGLFAYTGLTGPDPRVLQDAAAAASARGPHGHGWATAPNNAHRALNPLDPARLADVHAPRVIGHARMATRGDYRDPAALQPAHRGGHLLAHNGTVRNWAELDPDAPSDSHSLATAYAHHRKAGEGPATALRSTLTPAHTPAWALLVLDATGVLLAWRRVLPLWRLDHDTGVYYASRRFHPYAHLLADDALTVETP